MGNIKFKEEDLGRITSFISGSGTMYKLGDKDWPDEKVVNIYVYTPEYGNFIAVDIENTQSILKERHTKCFPISSVMYIRYEK
jgi:hypothetical protein